ncbi:ABC transporter substrate-binding protein [Clostridiales bacterium]|nr:ABC transporter substrate-binding protein [Clostridiales bacterium]
MKKFATWLIVLMLAVLPLAAAMGEAEEGLYDHLVVGNTTQMRGDFFTGMWGNATSDADVRDLLHGYNLVVWNSEKSMFSFNPTVVNEVMPMTDQAGDETFALILANDLRYSDGSRITAWDYAFSFLLQISPEIAELGAVPAQTDYLLGYDAYHSGETEALKGVRVEGNNVLVVTLRGEYLPFFYELALLRCNPYPIRVIAPGVQVKDDGEGVYLANIDDTLEEPVFTGELLRETLLDPETGYCSHPSVVSGPYTLTSFDGTTAEFSLNPFFKGDENGVKPTIPSLTYTLAENGTMVEKLQNGEFGLLNKVLRKDAIDAGLALRQEDPFLVENYTRNGLSYIAFACEKPAVSGEKVRQAIAWCMDRDQVTKDYAGDYGLRVDGYYGIGQWMYETVIGTSSPLEAPEEGDAQAQAEFEKLKEALEELNMDDLTVYAEDLEKAAALLDEDGWKVNEDGIREKEIEGEKVTLELTMLYPEGNEIGEVFQERLVPNLEQVGIRLTLEPMEMSRLLETYYKQDEDRSADMIYLASNFELVFDPSVQFIIDEDGTPNWSYTNHSDKELYDCAVKMRETEPGDILSYLKNWLDFQKRINETLPILPVYSNVYFDFYTNTLHDYAVGTKSTWAQAIVPAYLAEYVEEVPEEEAAEELTEIP